MILKVFNGNLHLNEKNWLENKAWNREIGDFQKETLNPQKEALNPQHEACQFATGPSKLVNQAKKLGMNTNNLHQAGDQSVAWHQH